ncbi:hypothetical protein MAPG_02791 [Magnaporthiopsis poae ATCC 64411]|uniref:Heterokaryon incompatibility domain-containing protein n=1 Tax=Magnaporthiopsis poae (strain ATCC 64411 / 73-15) TaxID=644358 RepID=A0A0C4DSB3_MAGP6|nr:hypothetical protein MAPG_02791 [Magnaporthiopsis poae ATCC 64411]
MDEKFQYQPLPPSDGLRILHLEASEEFASELVGTLSSVPFSARPAYVALSYTWQDRDADHAGIPLPASLLSSRTPFLRLKNAGDNGGPPGDGAPGEKPPEVRPPGEQPPGGKAPGAQFPIGHNLALALLHLRPRGGPPLPLWIDQICINQADNAERAAQVALMSFIYQRTRLVVCWLGIIIDQYAPPGHLYSFASVTKLCEDARRNKTRFWPEFGPIPSNIAPGHQTDLRAIYDMELYQWPDYYQIDPLNSYWQRIWIVQEVCLAPRLVYMQGPYVCGQTQLAGATCRSATGQRKPQSAGADKGWLQRLVEARAGRFSQAMRLEALVERFQGSGCHEPRDKLFALVGLAYDAWAVAEAENGDKERKRGSWSAKPERGDGRLSIDYERSFFDIWCDAVAFYLWQANPMTDFGKLPHEMEDERRAKIVRFAGTLQQAFGGGVHEEMASVSEATIESRGYVVAKGYIAGKIRHLGPTYDEYVGSHWKHSQWLQSWPRYYTEPSDMEELRKMEEQFSSKIIDTYTDADVARIKVFDDLPDCCFAYSPLALGGADPDGIVEAVVRYHPYIYRPVWLQESSLPPRRFLGSDRCMGMAPEGAQVGDLIVRFWNCDAAVVVRASQDRVPPCRDSEREPAGAPSQQIYHIIGRADVAEQQSRSPQDAKAKDKMKVYGAVFEGGRYVASGESPPRTDALYISMDLRTLQRVSEAIVIHE